MASAASAGYYGLEDRSLKMAILYMLCQGGAGGILTSGVGEPTSTPSSSLAIYINTTDGSLRTWYGGAWH